MAIEKYLDKMSEVECGINSYRGYFDDKHVTVEIGCRHIHIIDSASRATIHRSLSLAHIMHYVNSVCAILRQF